MSNEYGWTTEYILERSLQEIYWRIKTIFGRMADSRNFEMTLHGFELQGSEEKPEHVELSHNQQAAMDIALEKAKQRKAKQYGQKSSN